jgi:hypothetical protein
MKKVSKDNFTTKAEKREIKRRLRMKMHGIGLKKASQYAGKKLTNR